MRELGSVLVLMGIGLGAGVLVAAWCGFLVAIAIHVARWFL